MTLLLLSLVVLILCPLLVHVAQRWPMALSMLAGFVRIALPGLLCFHVVPQSVQNSGLWAVFAFIVGILIPSFLHRLEERSELAADQANHKPHAESIFFIVVVVASFIHATIDGLAFIDVDHSLPTQIAEQPHTHMHLDHTDALGWAVVLHRLPMGLSLWWFGLPRWGKTRVLLLYSMLAVGSSLGALFGNTLLAFAPLAVISIFQSLIAGAVLHAVASHGMTQLLAQQKNTPTTLWQIVGGILAILVLVQITHIDDIQAMIQAFWGLF